MELQWGQIVTQIIGFLLAVYLLKRYAWGSLLGFIEKRRETITSSFDEINRKMAEADAQKSRFDAELDRIEDTRRVKIQEAARDANKLAADIKEEARKDAVLTREKTQQEIALELDKANAILRDRMVDAVILSAEKVIKERLDQEKHRKLINDFLDELQVEK
jgi:F-type H+-transporting ATPase subunit b